MSAFLGWLLGTRTGRALLAVAALGLAVYATYRVVDHRAYERGAAAVQAEWDASTAKARQQAAAHGAKQAEAGADLAAKTTAKANAAHAQVEKTVTETKEVIRYVYRDRPITPPAGAVACLRPVDPRVQQRIELGVDQARSAAR